jgi:hypothetical protein
VLESNRAFNRTIYHLHQELELTVPFEEPFGACRRFIGLYQEIYRSGRLPYALFEVRFTPAGHDHTLISAGRDRRSTWIDLVCNDARGFERFYSAAEEAIKEIGARPHLGKFCESLGKADLARLHGKTSRGFSSSWMSTIPSGSLPTRSRGGFSGREAHVVYRREANLWRTGQFDPGFFPRLASWHWLALQSSERAARRGYAVS